MKNVTTQAVLSYFWSLFGAALLGYVVIKYGDYKEILLLVVGYVSGYVSNILGVYFSATKDGIKTTTESTEGGIKITEESK